MDTVFKYGHMVSEGDRFDFVTRTADAILIRSVVVRDVWASRFNKPSRWLELWTDDPDMIQMPVAIKLVGHFDHMQVTPAEPTASERLEMMNTRIQY